jgi:hypothetical protein
VKRSKPLRRDTAKAREFVERGRGRIKSDAEAAAAFLRRGREAGARSLRASSSAAAKAKPARRADEGPLSPADWRKAVYEASGRRCIISGARADDPFDPRFDAHHVLPKGELRARGLLQYVWDARNGVLLAERVHRQHTDAFLRIPREKVPPAAWEFAAELDARAGTEWATVMLERNYPTEGST